MQYLSYGILIEKPSLFLYWQASLIDEEEEIVELLSTSTRHKLSIAAAYFMSY